jgi:hypothetical protein
MGDAQKLKMSRNDVNEQLTLSYCWCFVALLVWILCFAGVDSPKIHTSKHKHQQNLAGITTENTNTVTLCVRVLIVRGDVQYLPAICSI